ncbi:hypothetical protein C9439_07135 [archaeon SCG-AAA382B04]|nr:hypothetical protein C9439_07135 [archaeon SCG-AAA382B04]
MVGSFRELSSYPLNQAICGEKSVILHYGIWGFGRPDATSRGFQGFELVFGVKDEVKFSLIFLIIPCSNSVNKFNKYPVASKQNRVETRYVAS